MNQPLQTAALANLIVASRLPAEGNFRRDAILGAMVGQVNPVAGALVAIRSADSLTELIRERDALKAQRPAPTPPVTTPAPPVTAPTPPVTAPAAGVAWPSALDEENRKAVQQLLRHLIHAAMKWLETLNPPPADGGPADAPGSAEEMASKFQKAASDVVAAVFSILAQAEKAVADQDENQAMMRQILERLASSESGSSAPPPTRKGQPG